MNLQHFTTYHKFSHTSEYLNKATMNSTVIVITIITIETLHSTNAVTQYK